MSMEETGGIDFRNAGAAYTKFYTKINEYFNDEKYSDVNITCGEKVFKCHRLVLAAASEHFDLMFRGDFQESRNREVVLKIDSATFELTLDYMYKGGVPAIHDKNVFNLLQAAGYLNLDYIEERCIHYLTENHVPIDYALQIFLYACVIKNRPLLWCASRCILDNLIYFTANDALLRLSFEELSTLLEFGLPHGFPKNERALLHAIHKWVSNLTCDREEKKSLYLQLTQNIRFQHISVLSFFDELNNGELEAGDLDTDSDSHTPDDLRLHVYINMPRYPSSWGPTYCYESVTTLFTRGSNNLSTEWYPRRDISSPPIDSMQTVEFNNRLYRLQLWAQQLSFATSSSVDFSALSSDSHLLTRPPFYNVANFSICSNGYGIYACSSLIKSGNLLNYNCELNEWFPLPYNRDNEFSPLLVTSCRNQLYIIGGDQSAGNYRQVRIYDCRAGKLEVLSECKLSHSYADQVCSHKDKIYMTSKPWRVGMEVYDPVANKWNLICNTTMSNCSIPYRLASIDNKLCAFTGEYTVQQNHMPLHELMIHRYDSFTEKWDEPDDQLYWTLKNMHQNMNSHCRWFNIVDVVVYKA